MFGWQLPEASGWYPPAQAMDWARAGAVAEAPMASDATSSAAARAVLAFI